MSPPKRKLPNWLTAYAKYTRHSESPDLFHFWTGVFTIAGALRRQVWIDQQIFQWTPNFYVVLVAPPGIVSKSTSLGLGTDLLREVDDIHFGPDSMTWQGLVSALEEAAELVPFGESDNIETQQFTPMSCITCSLSELGTFLQPDNQEQSNVLIDLWDGKLRPWKRMTKSIEGRAEIQNPWIHAMGCTTPSWLQTNFTEVMIGGGLTSRIVWVFGDKKRRLVAYPAEEVKTTEFEKMKSELIHDLRLIAKLKGEYKLTPEAIAFGTKWYEKHWAKRPEHMISERYGGYIARKQTHIHKLAMVLSAATRDDLIITEAELDLSDKVMTGLEASMAQVFQSIGVADNAKYITEILAYVRAHKEIADKKLWQQLLSIMGPKEYQEAIIAAVKAGYIKVYNRGGVVYYSPAEKPNA